MLGLRAAAARHPKGGASGAAASARARVYRTTTGTGAARASTSAAGARAEASTGTGTGAACPGTGPAARDADAGQEEAAGHRPDRLGRRKDENTKPSPPKKPRMDASRRGTDDRPMYCEAGVPKRPRNEAERDAEISKLRVLVDAETGQPIPRVDAEAERRRANESDRPLHRSVCRDTVADIERLTAAQRAKYGHPQDIPAAPRSWKNSVDAASTKIPPRKVFDGTRYFMNTLDEAITGPLAKSDRETLSPVDILWYTPYMEKALMTFYGVDYEFLAYLFRDSRLVKEPNLMTVVDNYDHSKNAPQVRQGTPEKPFRVVWPPFYEPGLSSQVRERLTLATMHPKFWLLVFPDFLRVKVSSSNLGGYDNKMNNQFWVCDFSKEGRAARAPRDARGRGGRQGPGGRGAEGKTRRGEGRRFGQVRSR